MLVSPDQSPKRSLLVWSTEHKAYVANLFKKAVIIGIIRSSWIYSLIDGFQPGIEFWLKLGGCSMFPCGLPFHNPIIHSSWCGALGIFPVNQPVIGWFPVQLHNMLIIWVCLKMEHTHQMTSVCRKFMINHQMRYCSWFSPQIFTHLKNEKNNTWSDLKWREDQDSNFAITCGDPGVSLVSRPRNGKPVCTWARWTASSSPVFQMMAAWYLKNAGNIHGNMVGISLDLAKNHVNIMEM